MRQGKCKNGSWRNAADWNAYIRSLFCHTSVILSYFCHFVMLNINLEKAILNTSQLSNKNKMTDTC